MSERPYAFMICREDCGTVSLTEAEYDRQLFNFGKPWYCPRCTAGADFDDEKTETEGGYGVDMFIQSLEDTK